MTELACLTLNANVRLDCRGAGASAGDNSPMDDQIPPAGPKSGSRRAAVHLFMSDCDGRL